MSPLVLKPCFLLAFLSAGCLVVVVPTLDAFPLLPKPFSPSRASRIVNFLTRTRCPLALQNNARKSSPTTTTRLLLQEKQQESSSETTATPLQTQQQRRRTWDDSFQVLLKFKEENGHCNVPAIHKQDRRLGNWVKNQRTNHRKGTLKEDRQARLESIGFSWSVREDSWEDNYQKLVKYHKNHGDCNVPFGWPNDKTLSQWVQMQRSYKDSLSDIRRSKLDRLGFSWNMTRTWDEMYQELVDYKDENGDCNVPIKYKPNPPLSNWVYRQRRRKTVLSVQEREKLNAIDFTWENSRKETYEKRWQEMLDKVKEYRNKHGNCHVPFNWSKDPALGRWVHQQRQNYKIGVLPEAREQTLNEIGFAWRLKDDYQIDEDYFEDLWLEKYELLKDFKEEHGHLNVATSYNSTLSNWVKTQRQNYHRGRLSSERQVWLEEIGFEWSVRESLQDEQWQKQYEEVKALLLKQGLFLKKHKCWLDKQRLTYASGKLNPERKSLLEDIGFIVERGGPYFPRDPEYIG